MTAPISVSVGSKSYKMNVEEGQEARVKSVATLLDGYVAKMQAAVGTSMDRDQLLVLSAIMMADDFYTLQQEKDTQEQTLAAFHNTLAEKLEALVK